MPFDLPAEEIIAFVKANGALAPLIVFLLAMGETLVIVSIFIPSTVVLFALGGLFALSGVPLLPSLLAGALGASLGFLVSYLIGATFQHAIPQLWPFRKYPELLMRAEAYSRRYGALGVLLGHFGGPLRPLIPVVAGVTRMAPVPFMLANIPGAVAWICVFLAPGYLVVRSETFNALFGSARAFF